MYKKTIKKFKGIHYSDHKEASYANTPRLVKILFFAFFIEMIAGVGTIAFFGTMIGADKSMFIIVSLISILILEMGIMVRSFYKNGTNKMSASARIVSTSFIGLGIFIILMLILVLITKNRGFIIWLSQFLLFLFFGLLLVIVGTKKHLQNKKCTVPVQALCIDITEKNDSHDTADNGTPSVIRNSSEFAPGCPVWEYSFNGQIIRASADYSAGNSAPSFGQVRQIFINPEKPEKYYDPADKQTNMFIPVGVSFLCITVLTVLILFFLMHMHLMF